MGYSVPVQQRISLAQLKQHVHTLPDQPDLIPYRTSYYAEDWAFCMPHRLLESLRDETYEVFHRLELTDGYLTYGSICIRAKRGRVSTFGPRLPPFARQRQLFGAWRC